MGARELLCELADAGFLIEAAGDKLLIRPAALMTDDMRAALREAKPELLEMLSAPRPYRLSSSEAERCHSPHWSDPEIATFVGRVTLLMRRGMSATDADDLAERLTLRDREGHDRLTRALQRHQAFDGGA
ncbi:MAG: hypothetical protein LKCHEGNO_01623 [Burkholderiaceae bacterium]|nr:hypothetical protein [Burkholderiaceae bacterium]